MAIDPRQEILRMMMEQQGGGGGGPQMANMMRNIDPTSPRQRGSESGGGGGGGAPWGRSRQVPPPVPQGMPQGAPPMSMPPAPGQGMPEQELMDDMSGGMPPEVMQLAALGIRPGDLQQSNPSTRRLPDRATDEEDVDPMESYGAPGDTEDPRFGPQDDPVRDETEGELQDVRTAINTHDSGGEADWEGDRTPTDADLEFVREHPTDSILNSFFERFPDWTAEDILMRGGDPSKSPDEYATSDEEWERMQSDRSTRIDER